MKSFSKSAAVLAGGMVFAGTAGAANVVMFEDFEVTPSANGMSFAQYGTGSNFSGSPHSGIPGGGSFYAWSPAGNDTAAAAVDLVAGDTIITFDGWLASWTGDGDTARWEAEFFDGLGGTGSSLGTVVLADGTAFTAAGGVTEYVDAGGSIVAGDAGSNVNNWSHYVTSNPIAAGAQSVVVHYLGVAGYNGNDAYADNVSIMTDVPEPGSLALLGLGGLLIARRRRA